MMYEYKSPLVLRSGMDDAMWLDEYVTVYRAGSIPVKITHAQVKRVCVEHGAWEQFKQEHKQQQTYRARLVFEWLGY